MHKTSEYNRLSQRIRYHLDKNYRQRKLERARLKSKLHYQKNKQQILQQQKEYYQKNREEILKKSREKNRKRILRTLKSKTIIGRKRLYPKDNTCELCQIIRPKYLKYHHWKIIDGNIYGIWLCSWCHIFVEFFEKRNYIPKYKKLKEIINKSNPIEW